MTKEELMLMLRLIIVIELESRDQRTAIRRQRSAVKGLRDDRTTDHGPRDGRREAPRYRLSVIGKQETAARSKELRGRSHFSACGGKDEAGFYSQID
jgi:hypothetical protein